MWVYGPNGFARQATGTATSGSGVEAALKLDGGQDHPRLQLAIANNTDQPQTVRVNSAAVDRNQRSTRVAAHGTQTLTFDPIGTSHGWYDLSLKLDADATYLRHFAGHLENGQSSRTRP